MKDENQNPLVPDDFHVHVSQSEMEKATARLNVAERTRTAKAVYAFLALAALAFVGLLVMRPVQETRTPQTTSQPQFTPQSVTQVAQNTSRITGAFGFTLGQPVPAELHLSSPDTLGSINFTIELPFHSDGPGTFVLVDEDGLVYSILATVHKLDLLQLYDETREATRKALTDKYGTPKREYYKNSFKLTFNSGDRSVQMGWDDDVDLFHVEYVDESLRRKHWQKEEQKKNAAIGKTAAGLSKRL